MMASNYGHLLAEEKDVALFMCRLGSGTLDTSTTAVIVTDAESSIDTQVKDTNIQERRKYRKQIKDPKRDTSVTFDEMNRLMKVYGPIKYLRTNLSRPSSKVPKPESVKRRFYRWFPDFSNRFVKDSEGWWVPKAGHYEEIEHRKDLRMKDQLRVLAKKEERRRLTKIAKV